MLQIPQLGELMGSYLSALRLRDEPWVLKVTSVYRSHMCIWKDEWKEGWVPHIFVSYISLEMNVCLREGNQVYLEIGTSGWRSIIISFLNKGQPHHTLLKFSFHYVSYHYQKVGPATKKKRRGITAVRQEADGRTWKKKAEHGRRKQKTHHWQIISSFKNLVPPPNPSCV